jgi:hypothetical protein
LSLSSAISFHSLNHTLAGSAIAFRRLIALTVQANC